MIRFGLCCLFRKAAIKFRRTTAKYLRTQSRQQQLQYLSEICLHNAQSLLASLKFCVQNNIGDFRINSQILPLKTHPDIKYEIEELPNYKNILAIFFECGEFSRTNDLRTTFHPDQFILLSSPDPAITARSVADLKYQAQVATWIQADVINIHAGGAYGKKDQALRRLARQIEKLPDTVRTRLTLENDDRIYTPSDLLPVCKATEIPFVYDVHHHRCLPDGLSTEYITEAALATWNREPLFHISSPLGGWNGGNPRHHDDYVKLKDFPDCWLDLDLTVEIEAKAKELAVLKLIQAIEKKQMRTRK
ncbi:MAG: UV DNA damage repair endonuclease UvsE [Desulfobacterales bacterium]|jgi:UV DNA damage endonuclease